MERYERTSIIDTVATVERYDETLHSRLPFIQIGLRVPVRKDWIEAENRILLVDSLGSSVALSERRLLQRSPLAYTEGIGSEEIDDMAR